MFGHFQIFKRIFQSLSIYEKNICGDAIFIESKYTDDCTVLPNQVNTKLFKNDLERHIDGTFNLIMVCALREGKRLDVAFDSLKMLKEEHFDVHLDIIGDGFYEETFKRSFSIAFLYIFLADATTFSSLKESAIFSKSSFR